MTVPSTNQVYEEGFKRVFSSVFHYWELFSDGRSSLEKLVSRDLAPWCTDFMRDTVDSPESRVTTFHVLNAPSAEDQMIWMEMYPDLMTWAKTDYMAQTGGEWFKELREFFQNPGVRGGLSQIMVEDTLPKHGNPTQSHLDGGTAVIQWTAFRGQVLSNTQILPGKVARLQTLLDLNGINAHARFFGMATCAGPDRDLAHLWLEFPDHETRSQFLAMQVEDPALAEWRRDFWSQIQGIEWDRLMRQIP